MLRFAVVTLLSVSVSMTAAARTDPASHHLEMPEASCTATAMSCGFSGTASLSPTGSCIIDTFPTANYSFGGAAGQNIQLHATTAVQTSIGMTLTDAFGTPITNAFDEPADIDVTLPATGQYLVSVNFGNPHLSGAFTLTFNCNGSSTPGPPTGTCQYTGTLAIGSTVTSQLTTADAACGDSTTFAKAYKVPVNAGDAFTATYSAGYVAYLEIKGPDTSGAFRSASAGSLTMSYVAPATGNVTIFAASNTKAPVTGQFTLQLTPLQLPSCGKPRAVKH